MGSPRFRRSGGTVRFMPHYRIRDAAGLLGVSDDTVRRWIDGGLTATGRGRPQGGRGRRTGGFARDHAGARPADPSGVRGRPGTVSSDWSPGSSPMG